MLIFYCVSAIFFCSSGVFASEDCMFEFDEDIRAEERESASKGRLDWRVEQQQLERPNETFQESNDQGEANESPFVAIPCSRKKSKHPPYDVVINPNYDGPYKVTPPHSSWLSR